VRTIDPVRNYRRVTAPCSCKAALTSVTLSRGDCVRSAGSLLVQPPRTAREARRCPRFGSNGSQTRCLLQVC
jgi:hypothetical protein